jgi:DNA-binding transcriptional MerR regulator
MESTLPPIPAKRYFTIGEVGDLCGVKPHVLRYWEQEFTQLRPMKRRGNRRYYQHHEVLMIRRIRELLYDQGFTISGARTRLQELDAHPRTRTLEAGGREPDQALASPDGRSHESAETGAAGTHTAPAVERGRWEMLMKELVEIRELLTHVELGRPGAL